MGNTVSTDDPGPAADNACMMRAGAGYRCAFLCGRRGEVHLPPKDPFRIDRLAVYRDTDLSQELGIRV